MKRGRLQRYHAALLLLTLPAVISLSAQSLKNGQLTLGAISVPREVDTWTFEGSSGQRVHLRLGETDDGTGFHPTVTLTGPNGSRVDTDHGPTEAWLSATLDQSGRYTVTIQDRDTNGNSAGEADDDTGSYRLELQLLPLAYNTSPNDDGGVLTPGAIYEGTIDIGDLDRWTLEGEAGQTAFLRLGETEDGSGLHPWTTIIDPAGNSLASDDAPADGWILVRLPSTGTYSVLVSDLDTNGSASGEHADDTGRYRLELHLTNHPPAPEANDDGGPIEPGKRYTGHIHPGDIDHWTFTSELGQHLSLRLGETDDGSGFHPWIALYDAQGNQIARDEAPADGRISTSISPGGPYSLFIADFDTNGNANGEENDDTGSYQIEMHLGAEPFDVATNDEGGPLANGAHHEGKIEVGDVDRWTFSSQVGDYVSIRLAETDNGTGFSPWLGIVAPAGDLIRTDDALSEGVQFFTSEQAGTYSVLVTDHDDNGNASGEENDDVGAYRLEWVHVPGDFVVDPTDDGGSLQFFKTKIGQLSLGDIDHWTFPTIADAPIKIRVQSRGNLALEPRVLLLEDTGNELVNRSDGILTDIEFIPRISGLHHLVVLDNDSNGNASGEENDDVGEYEITLESPVPVFRDDNPLRVNETVMNELFIRADALRERRARFEFELVSGPEGLTLEPFTSVQSKLFWTPTEAQGPGVYQVTLRVSNTYLGSTWSTTHTFDVTVNEMNTEVDIVFPEQFQVDEETLLTIPYQIIDPDIPINEHLVEQVQLPKGMQINLEKNQLEWTPSEDQGPGEYEFGVVVSDSNPLAVNLTGNARARWGKIVVNEVNRTPKIADLPPIQIEAGQPLQLQIEASDADLPANTLIYSLGTAPEGMTIDANKGEINWQSPQATSNEAQSLEVTVTDSAGASVTRIWPIDLLESDQPPNMRLPSDALSFDENVENRFQIEALDPDSPTDELSFSIETAPEGLRLDENSGWIVWTPDEFQGGLKHDLIVSVRDSNNPPLTTTGTVSIEVKEDNRPPTFNAHETQYELGAGDTWGIKLTATDGDVPTNQLTYSIEAASSSITIDCASGQLSWIAPQAETTATVKVTVTDDGVPPASVSTQLTLHVTPLAPEPSLILPPNQTVPELSEFQTTLAIANPSSEESPWQFSLTRGPSTATLDPNTGGLSWTPTEDDGPGTFEFGVLATGSTELNGTFSLSVEETNSAPVLSPIPPQSASATIPFSIMGTAVDSDRPANVLNYSLVDSPDGMTLNSETGELSWTPEPSHTDQDVSVTIRVSDNGIPPLTDETSFSIRVISADVELPQIDPTEPIASTIAGRLGPSGTVYTISENIVVPAGETLHIDPGVTLQFTGADDNLTVQGTLIAAGTPEAPITFTSDNASKRAGQWQSIRFENSNHSVMRHCVVEYGGWFNALGRPMIELHQSSVQLDHCTISASDGVGLALSASSPTISNTHFENNHGYAASMDTASFPQMQNLSGPVAAIEIRGGHIVESGTWENATIPFTITSDVTLNTDAQLTIEPGTTVQFAGADDNLVIHGNLHAVGTAQLPITFTSNNASKRAGQWQSIRFIESAKSQLVYCTIEYGGWFNAVGRPMIEVRDSDLSVRHAMIRASDQNGIFLQTSSAVIEDSLFEANHGYAASMDPNSFPQLARLRSSGNSIEIRGGTMETSGDWEASDVPFTITSDVTVATGTTLTIEAGTTVQFASADDNLIIEGTCMARGLETAPIRFTSDNASKAAGQWQSIQFIDSINSELSHCIIEYGGWFNAIGHPMIELQNSTLALRDSVIRSSDGIGLSLQNASPTLESSHFEANHGYAASMDTDSFPHLANLSAPGSSIEIRGGTITGVGTWESSGIPFTLTNDITVAPGITLTVEPDTIVQFEGADDNLIVQGTLVARGTSEERIRFTSDNSSKRAGQWQSLRFIRSTGSQLSHCIFEYGGWFNASGRPMIDIQHSQLSLTDSIIRESDQIGLSLTASSPTIENTLLENNHSYAASMDVDSFPHLSRLTAPNSSVAIRGGTLTRSGTWESSGVPYTITSDVTVSSDLSLGIEAGTIVQFKDADNNLVVNGTLQAGGTADAPILFTSDNQSKRPGQWQSLRFLNSSGSVLTHCNIEYGGWFNAAGRPMVELIDASVDFFNCHITQSDAIGVQYTQSGGRITGSHLSDHHNHAIQTTNQSAPHITRNTIQNNLGLGVNNLDTTIILSAPENFWGQSSGPRDEADLDGLGLTNFEPRGERVSEFVDWSSPAATPPGNVSVETPELPELPAPPKPPLPPVPTPQRPSIEIQRQANGQILLSWQSTRPLLLQQADSLNTNARWQTLESSSREPNHHKATITPTSGAAFFRLTEATEQ